MINKQLLILFFLITTNLYAANAPWVGADLSGNLCTGDDQGYGPYDYTMPKERAHAQIVERHHFTPKVENHISGQSGYLSGDLDYTLRAFPNHPKALLSVIRYQLKLNKKLLAKNDRLKSPVECYLQRAMHFSPTDSTPPSLFAYYLKEIGQLEKADKLYSLALSLSPNNAKIAYSYSLLLIKLKQYDKAVEYAEKAYLHGKPPDALKKKLINLGVWNDQ